jgi:hypothetical protein
MSLSTFYAAFLYLKSRTGGRHHLTQRKNAILTIKYRASPVKDMCSDGGQFQYTLN